MCKCIITPQNEAANVRARARVAENSLTLESWFDDRQIREAPRLQTVSAQGLTGARRLRRGGAVREQVCIQLVHADKALHQHQH